MYDLDTVCLLLTEQTRRRRRIRNQIFRIDRPAEQSFTADLIDVLGIPSSEIDQSKFKELYRRAKKIRDKVLKVAARKEFSLAAFQIALVHNNRQEREKAYKEFKDLLMQEYGELFAEEEREVIVRQIIEITSSLRGLQPLKDAEKAIEKPIKELTMQLPVYQWWCSISGLNYSGLADIVGETGNLFNYSRVSKVWKRMGLSVYKGKSGSYWKRRGGLTSEEFQEMGYKPRRRAVTYPLVEALIKTQGQARIADDSYYQFAIQRRDMKIEQEWKRGHAWNHAKRVLAKRILQDLYNKWYGRSLNHKYEEVAA